MPHGAPWPGSMRRKARRRSSRSLGSIPADTPAAPPPAPDSARRPTGRQAAREAGNVSGPCGDLVRPAELPAKPPARRPTGRTRSGRTTGRPGLRSTPYGTLRTALATKRPAPGTFRAPYTATRPRPRPTRTPPQSARSSPRPRGTGYLDSDQPRALSPPSLPPVRRPTGRKHAGRTIARPGPRSAPYGTPGVPTKPETSPVRAATSSALPSCPRSRLYAALRDAQDRTETGAQSASASSRHPIAGGPLTAPLGACAVEDSWKKMSCFQPIFCARECPEMRNHAENLVSGNVQACCAVAIFSTAQAPRCAACVETHP